MSILDALVTLFRSCKDTKPAGWPSLAQVLTSIRSPRQSTQEIITACRAEPDKDKRRPIKAKLPAIVFGAELNHREGGDQAGQSRKPSGLLCLDFDHLTDMAAARKALTADPHTLAVFTSPSGDGLKVLVPVLSPIEDVWITVANWFSNKHTLEADQARKDKHGLCFASWDADLFVAADPDAVEPFVAVATAPAQTTASFPVEGQVLAEYLDLATAEGPLNRCDPDCPYEQWLEIGMALHCQFSGSFAGLGLFDLWSSRGKKYAGQKEVQAKWRSFKAEGFTFRTVLKRAGDAGWTKPGRPRRTIEQPTTTGKSDPLGDLIAAETDGSYALAAWPFPCLTAKARSLMPGSVTVMCGAPGGSKTWFLLSCLREWVEQKISADVLMLEENKGWHLKRLLAQLQGDPNYLDSEWCRCHPEDVNRAHQRHRWIIDDVGAHIWCDGNVRMEACAKWVEERCEAGTRILAIDPITLADPGGEKTWDADRKFMARCKVAIEKAGASLVLVSHPKKASGGKAMPPQMDDLAGGAAYSRAAASVLWISGLPDIVESPVVNADGQYRQATVHKTIQILKARNGVGQGATIGMAFSELNFSELGVMVRQGKPPKADASHQAARLRQQPRRGEDLFNEQA